MDTFSFLICLKFCSSFFVVVVEKIISWNQYFKTDLASITSWKELLLINRTKTWDVTWTSPQRLKTWLGLRFKDLRLDLDLDLKDLRLDLDLDLRDLWTCLVFSKSNFSLFCLHSRFLFPVLVSWINPCLADSDSVYTSFGLLLRLSDYPSSQALWILFADERPTHALLLCLACAIPVCWCFDPACDLTMFINKSLQMDPNFSRLVGAVTLIQSYLQTKTMYIISLSNTVVKCSKIKGKQIKTIKWRELML